jgi:hypothetical protein
MHCCVQAVHLIRPAAISLGRHLKLVFIEFRQMVFCPSDGQMWPLHCTLILKASASHLEHPVILSLSSRPRGFRETVSVDLQPSGALWRFIFSSRRIMRHYPFQIPEKSTCLFSSSPRSVCSELNGDQIKYNVTVPFCLSRHTACFIKSALS